VNIIGPRKYSIYFGLANHLQTSLLREAQTRVVSMLWFERVLIHL